MNNFGGGMATGMMTGYIIGQQTEASKNRRLSQMGSDQLLLKVKADKDKVGQALSRLISKTEYNGKLVNKVAVAIDWWAFTLCFILVGFVFFLIGGLLYPVWLTFKSGLLITFVISILFGMLIFHREFEEIKIGTSGIYTTVLIKVYDSEGYRNFDKIAILDIIETLEDLYKGEKEVSKSLGGQN